MDDALDYICSIKSAVVQGEKRGRAIGFLTANTQPSDDYLLPRKGVYTVSIRVGAENKSYRGVANIGIRPTLHDPNKAEVVVEVSIFDLEDNIYGERVTVSWHHFLRPEIKFNGVDPSVKQVSDDKSRAKYLLAVGFGDEVAYNI